MLSHRDRQGCPLPISWKIFLQWCEQIQNHTVLPEMIKSSIRIELITRSWHQEPKQIMFEKLLKILDQKTINSVFYTREVITWGNAVSDDNNTFSGFKSQWTMCLECKCFSAIKICIMKIKLWDQNYNGKLVIFADRSIKLPIFWHV